MDYNGGIQDPGCMSESSECIDGTRYMILQKTMIQLISLKQNFSYFFEKAFNL